MAAADTLREVSSLVAEAITKLVSLGADAPLGARCALMELGEAYMALGYTDRGLPYGAGAEEGMGGD